MYINPQWKIALDKCTISSCLTKHLCDILLNRPIDLWLKATDMVEKSGVSWTNTLVLVF